MPTPPVQSTRRGRIMAGRTPKLNWTASRNQYTTTIHGKLHHLGTDEENARQEYQFLIGKADMGEAGNASLTFAEIADRWLTHVQQTYSLERYRLCAARLNEF